MNGSIPVFAQLVHLICIMSLLLRYVEIYGEMRRGITVLKMRGAMHDKRIREFTIDGNGMHIEKPFRNVTGIISGNPVHTVPSEIERIDGLFQKEEGML